LGALPARANDIDVTIPSGEAVSGSIDGHGADTYKVFVNSTGSLTVKLEGSAVSQIMGLGVFGFALAPADPKSGPTKITVYRPDGVKAGNLWCAATCNTKFAVTAKGVWTFVVSMQDQDKAAGHYKLSVNEQG
jgi:hypothetical protein